MRIDDLEGKEVARRFALKKMIGKGGYGAVFEAEQLSVGRRCAVKILLPGYGDEDAVEQRFRAEARATSRLTHPNSIVLFDFGVDESTGFLFLATEFLDGDTLYEVMARETTMGLERTLMILEQVAGSLGDAHRLGLVHRDIKPKNIMLVNRAGQRDFVKVIDFGIAKTLGSGLGSDEGLTKTGMMVGTPQYMAPEQLLGSGMDGSIDQYALAVVGYKMLTGRNPFQGSTPMEIAMRHINDRPLPLRTYRPDLKVTSEFEDVFLKALAKVPEHRFKSVQAFVDALREAHGDAKESSAVVHAGVFGEVDVRMMQKQTLMLDDVDLGEESDGSEQRSEKVELATEVVEESGDAGGRDEVVNVGEEEGRSDERTSDVLDVGRKSEEGGETRRSAPPEAFTGEDAQKITMEVRKREPEDTTGIHPRPGRLQGMTARGIPKVAIVACSVAFLFSSLAILLLFFGNVEEVAAEAEEESQSPVKGVEESHAVEVPEEEQEVDAEEALRAQLREEVEVSIRAGYEVVVSGLTLAREDAMKEQERLEEEARRAEEARARRRANRPGEVTVTMIPWGTLVVNGESHGEATRQELRLPPGRHQLALHQNGVLRASTTVDVRAGQSRMVVLEARLE